MATPVRSQPARRRGLRPAQVVAAILTLLLWLGALAVIFPIAWTALASFRPDSSFLSSPFKIDPGEWIRSNFATAFKQGDFAHGFLNSFVQVAIILCTTLFFCPLAGFGFAKFRFRGRGFLFSLMMLTLFFVPITQYVPLLIEMNNLGWIDTFQGLVMPLIISSFGIFWMSSVIAGVPDELLQAARVDGCGSFAVFWRIVLPVVRPALVSLGVVTFLTAYNDYFWPLLIVPERQTIQVVLANLQSTMLLSAMTTTANWGPILAAATVVMLPTIVVFLIMQRFFLRGVLQGSLKG
jgi:ABC-type glycerol-3-phosphate transport system permease component